MIVKTRPATTYEKKTEDTETIGFGIGSVVVTIFILICTALGIA